MVDWSSEVVRLDCPARAPKQKLMGLQRNNESISKLTSRRSVYIPTLQRGLNNKWRALCCIFSILYFHFCSTTCVRATFSPQKLESVVNKLEYLLIWNSNGVPPPNSVYTISSAIGRNHQTAHSWNTIRLRFCFELHTIMPLWPFHHRTKDIWRRQMTIRKRQILCGQLFRLASSTGQL